jgi:methyl-accepting chemotaxis protein
MINTSSDKIAKIIKVIDEIAFQTNILALERGGWKQREPSKQAWDLRVADELHDLAQRSAQAA